MTLRYEVFCQVEYGAGGIFDRSFHDRYEAITRANSIAHDYFEVRVYDCDQGEIIFRTGKVKRHAG